MILTKKGLERVYRLDKSIEQTNPVMVTTTKVVVVVVIEVLMV